MGLFDGVLGMLGGQQQPDDSRARLLEAAAAMLSSNSQVGGLQGLVDKFQEAGLGNVIGSWIGPGQNQPISPEQVQQALGENQLQQISEQSGLPPEQTAGHLSDLLPSLIDKLTPNGEIPEGGLGQAGALLGRLLGRQ